MKTFRYILSLSIAIFFMSLHCFAQDTITEKKANYNSLMQPRTAKTGSANTLNTNANASKSPLYVILADGKTFHTTDKKNVMPNIKPDQIESLNILKNQASLAKYGKDATDGVVEVTLKKGELSKLPKKVQAKFN